MFSSYLQLQRRPFSSIPSPDHYFPASAIEAARTTLVQLIERQQGPALVLGGVGLGKSLLCQLLAESFRHRCRTVTLLSARLCTRRALLQVILYELGLPYRDMEEGELRLALIGHITNTDLCPRGIVLLVDEADNLTMALLDELRSLTNLATDGAPAVRLVLFGGPRLEEKFAHPRLESFNQRLAGRFYLEPFTAQETRDYVKQQLAEVDQPPSEVFTTEALQQLHAATDGIPRLVNQLADHALVVAAAEGRSVIDHDHVDEAWADLQQLPFPKPQQGAEQQGDLPADIFEFGHLDDAERNDSANNEATEEALDRVSNEMKEIEAGDEHTTESLENEDTQDATAETTADHEPEVTLYFHEAHDPFGDGFDDEETVIDHFVSPAPISPRQRRPASAFEYTKLTHQLTAERPDEVNSDPDDGFSWNLISLPNQRDPTSSNEQPTVLSHPTRDDAKPRGEEQLVDPAATFDQFPGSLDSQPLVPPCSAECDFRLTLGGPAASSLDETLPELPFAPDTPPGGQFIINSQVELNDEPSISTAWRDLGRDDLERQGLHFEEYDLINPPGAASYADAFANSDLPAHLAGEAVADASVPDEERTEPNAVPTTANEPFRASPEDAERGLDADHETSMDQAQPPGDVVAASSDNEPARTSSHDASSAGSSSKPVSDEASHSRSDYRRLFTKIRSRKQ